MKQTIRTFFGGAFDPVHFGHIKPALELAAQSRIEQVRYVPCGEHPYAKRMEATKHRVRMLELVQSAATPVDRCAIDYELRHTIDLLRHLRDTHGNDAPIAFVLGDDSYADIPNWKHAKELKKISHFIVLSRENSKSPSANAELSDLAHSAGGLTHFFNNRPQRVSSTQVRDNLRAKREPRGLLPGVVWNYIRRNRLYANESI